MLTHELSHVILNFKTRVHHRPVMSSSDECEKRKQILETSTPECLAQDLPRALGLRGFYKDQCGQSENLILEVRLGSRPINRALDLSEGFIDGLKLSPPRRSYLKELEHLINGLRRNRAVA